MEQRERIVELTREYMRSKARKGWRPGLDLIPYADASLGEGEIASLVDTALGGWLTLGPKGDIFEKKLKDRIGVRDVVLVNSGSSANLIAVSSLCSELVERRLMPGDEVIVPATSFPTTVAPLIQNGLVPVFVDCELGTYNANLDQVERAISASTKIKAIVLSHTLGNVFDLDRVVELCRKWTLYLIEDCCDALGSTWNGKSVGTFGDFASLSFYPSHHITTGEGGAVLTNKARYGKTARTMRDWGRDCWCATGVSNTCGKRFGWQLGDMPEGYDHKYVYSAVGYNVKPTDLQASVGLVQVDRLPEFIRKRKENFKRIREGLESLPWLMLPTWDPRADVSWFSFPITVQWPAPFGRRELVAFLESQKIDTRMLFAGNLLRQPGYRSIRHRVCGELTVSDYVMNRTFMIGLHPGITNEMVDFMVSSIRKFVAQNWTST